MAARNASRMIVESLERRLLLSGNDVLFGGVDFASNDSAKLASLNTVFTSGTGEVSLQASVTVLNQTFSATLDVTATGPIASPQFTIAATDAAYTLTDSTGSTLVSYLKGAGSFTISSAGIKGSASGTVNVTVPGVTFNAPGLELDLDTTTTPGEFALSGSVDDLSIAGRTLVGTAGATDFRFAKGAAGVSLHLGGVSASVGSFASVSNLTGDFTVSGGISGGVKGSVSGTPHVSVPGLDYSGSLALTVDTTAGASDFELAGTIDNLSIAGQTLSGAAGAGFDFKKSADSVELQISHAGIDLGPAGSPVASLSDLNGQFVVTSAGVYGAVQGTATLAPGLGVSLGSNQLRLGLNTTSTATPNLDLGDGAADTSLPAGPYVAVGATGTTLTVAGQSLTGGFFFEKSATDVKLRLEDGAINLGPAGSPIVSVNQLNSSFTAASDGISGSIGGHLDVSLRDASSNPIVSLSGGIHLAFATGGLLEVNSVDGDPLTVTAYAGGQALISLSGAFDFTIGSSTSPTPGFKLKSFSLSAGGFTLSSPTGASHAASPADTTTVSPLDGSADTKKLGPLTFQGLAPKLNHFDFTGGVLNFDLGFSADGASLDFSGKGGSTGDNPGGVHAAFSKPAGSTDPALAGSFGLQLAVTPTPSIGAGGKFNFTAQQFDFSVANAVTGTFNGIQIGYDPAGPADQRLVTLNSGSVVVPKLDNLTFTLQPGADQTPGLVITGQGFHFANLSVGLIHTYKIGPVSFSNPTVTLSNFGVSYANGQVGADFGNSTLSLGVSNVSVGVGPFTAAGTNLTATLQFAGGSPSGFVLKADGLDFKFGKLLDVTASDVTINTTAQGTDPLLTTGSVTASLDIPAKSLNLSGTVGNFEVLADGSFSQVDGKPFVVNFSLTDIGNSGAAGDLNWPKIFPLQIDKLELAWNDVKNNPSDFTIDLSAEIHTNIKGMSIDASVTDAIFDIPTLINGDFPVIGIDSVTGSVGGTLFGATVSAGIAGGVVKVDDNGLRIPAGNPDNVHVSRSIFYMGMRGTLGIEGIPGMSVQFGFSQLGPLSVYLELSTPDPQGVIIEPDSGLAINDLRGGITFNASPLPLITDARDLNLSVFSPPNKLTTEQWNAQMQQQVINQLGGGAGLIFGIGAGAVTDLTSTTTTIPADLSALYDQNSYPLTHAASIQSTGPADWLITDGAVNYLIEKRDDGAYDVSQLVAAIDPALFPTAPGTLDPASGLFAAFSKLGITLDAATTATADAIRPGRWTLESRGVKYVLSGIGSEIAVTGGAGSVDQMTNTLRIDAGATILDAYASEDAIKGDVDITILTNGQFLLSGGLTFGNSLTLQTKLYADFRALTSNTGPNPTGGAVVFNMLTELPAPPQDPLLMVYGTVVLKFIDGNNQVIDHPGVGSHASSVRIELSGGADINAFDQQKISVHGDVLLTFSAHSFTVNLLDATLSVQGLVTGQLAEASGSLTVDTSSFIPRVYGAVSVKVDASNIPQLASAGITLSGDAFVRINTTGQDLTAQENVSGNPDPITVSLPAGSAGLFVYGRLGFAKAGVTADFSGAFGIQYSVSDGLDVFLAATLQLEMAGKPIFGFQAVGALIVHNDGGIALFGDLARSASVSQGDVSFDGSIDLQLFVNTIGQDAIFVVPADLQAVIDHDASLSKLLARFAAGGADDGNGKITITVPGGAPPLDPAQSASHTGSPYIVFRGTADLNLLGQFTLTGKAYALISNGAFDLTASGSLVVGPLGTIDVGGTMHVTADGLVAALDAHVHGGTTLGSGSSISLQGALSLVLNTTNRPANVNVPNNSGGLTTLSSVAPHSVHLHVDGTVNFGNFAGGNGSADVAYDNSSLVVAANVDINLADAIHFHLNGTAIVYADGIGLNINDISVDAGINVGSIFTINATATGSVQINTTLRPLPVGGQWLDPNSFHLDVRAGVNLLSVLTLNGELIIDVRNGQWSISIPQSNPLSVNFFDVGTISAWGAINSHGAFILTFKGSIFFGDPQYAALGGSGVFAIGNDPYGTGFPTGLQISGSASGGIYVDNQLIVGGDASLNYDSTTGDLNVDVGYDFIWHHTFSVYLDNIPASNAVKPPPPPIYLAGSFASPTTFSGGVLYLNMGDDRAIYRNFDTGDVNETAFLVGGAAANGAQSITVWMLGKAQQFNGVTEVIVNGGSGNDFISIGSSVSVPVIADAGTGNNEIDNHSAVGGIFSASGGTNVINGGTGADAITGGVGAFTINGGGGGDEIHIAPAGNSNSTYNITEPADGSGNRLIVNALAGVARIDLDATDPTHGSIQTNPGAGGESITYAGLDSLTVTANNSNDTFDIRGTAADTTVNVGFGNDTVNVGTAAPGTGGVLAAIYQPLFIHGSGSAALTLDDSGDTSPAGGTLASTQITGFGTAGISFNGLSTLNFNLGSGGASLDISDTSAFTRTTVTGGAGPDVVLLQDDHGITTINTFGGDDTINVRATHAPTTVDTGQGSNRVNIGGLAPFAGGVLDNVQGRIVVGGSGSDTMYVDDTGSTIAKSANLTASSVTGLGMTPGGILFSGMASLNLGLGSGGNTIEIDSTSAQTSSTVNSGSGNDTVTLVADSGPTTINTGAGHDQLNVRSTGAATAINTGADADIVAVGSFTPALVSGVVNQIQSPLTVTGNGADTLILDDTGDVAPARLVITPTSLTGLGMGPAGIALTGIAQLNIALGSGGNNVLFNGTAPATSTLINTGSGDDTVNVRAAAGPVVIVTGGGVNTVNLGSLAPGVGGNLNAITGPLTVSGSSADTLNLDDSANTTSKTIVLTPNMLTGATGAPITYTGLANLNISLGSGGNSFTVNDINPTTHVTVDGGPSAIDAIALNFAANFAGRIDLTSFEHTTVTVNQDFTGALTDNGPIDSVTINGSLTRAGALRAVNAAQPASGNITSLTVGQDLAGTVLASGSIGAVSILSGSFTPTAGITAAGLGTFNIGPDRLNPGQNLAGNVSIGGTIGSVRVAGGTPGLIAAGHIGSVAVYGGFGPEVARVIENGTERRIELATPADPFPQPDPTVSVTGPYVNVQYLYESGSLSNPQLTARLTNNVSSAKDQYDLSLVVYSDTAKFNLARLDSTGISGARNVVVEGDLLPGVTSAAFSFFKMQGNPAFIPGGIHLPADNLAAVGIRDFAPDYSVQARSIQAIAFGSHREDRFLEPGSQSSGGDAAELLAWGTALAPANDTFRVPFADLPQYGVGLFIVTDRHGGYFDNDSIDFTVQGVNSPNTAGTSNITRPSNTPRGAATALITVAPGVDRRGYPTDSVVQSISIRGDGASIQTDQWVAKSITSTGPLGDLYLSSHGISDITAPSIFGSIVTDGAVTGTIETTGLRSDPITGATTGVPADLGSTFVAFGRRGPYVTNTVLEAEGGISGRVISRGNLISSIFSDNDITGVIAAQGNLGATFTTGGVTTRLGGLTSEGRFQGQLVVLGDAIGDITIDGGLKAGRIAVKGSILGNMEIDGGLDSGSAIIAGGAIGSTAFGTSLTVNGRNAGIIAARNNILFSRGKPSGSVFTNAAATPSGAAINAIFTNSANPLLLDVNPQDLQGLQLILTDLLNLRLNTTGSLSGPVA